MGLLLFYKMLLEYLLQIFQSNAIFHKFCDGYFACIKALKCSISHCLQETGGYKAAMK